MAAEVSIPIGLENTRKGDKVSRRLNLNVDIKTKAVTMSLTESSEEGGEVVVARKSMTTAELHKLARDTVGIPIVGGKRLF